MLKNILLGDYGLSEYIDLFISQLKLFADYQVQNLLFPYAPRPCHLIKGVRRNRATVLYRRKFLNNIKTAAPETGRTQRSNI